MDNKTFLDRFNKNEEEKESLVEEFGQLYIKIFGHFIYSDNKYIGHGGYFESINKIRDIILTYEGICLDVSLDIPDKHEDYSSEQDFIILLPLDFFDNYDKYLEDKNKQIEESKESERQNKISRIKKEIDEKIDELYNLTENCYYGDIKTLLEDI